MSGDFPLTFPAQRRSHFDSSKHNSTSDIAAQAPLPKIKSTGFEQVYLPKLPFCLIPQRFLKFASFHFHQHGHVLFGRRSTNW
uniref:Uncharacterized protein n=1 Tax=Panagrolaimus sp. JU765 TaxID=591449 RepID=A0AC34QF15_9BILA